jgi:hypothetical protein
MKEQIFRFNFLAFIIAFTIGILFVYLSAPKQKIIIKYPNPYNSDKIVYRSENDVCYKYKAEKVDCNSNAIEQPVN